MQKLPRLSGKELIKIISKLGFKTIRQRGSHVFMAKETDKEKITTVVPLHNEIDRGTLLEIIRQIKLTKEQFLELVDNQ
ncbi:type II toxin-antitoxin system HicA family toxin [Candidatus Pacearchaeota archaeon]|nr:type II toxin-antitoxin system HicA family toxin [Candidatus Pacearchaeota archaeon]